MAERIALPGRLRVILPAIVLGLGVIVGLYYGIGYWIYTTKHVVTDDARVKGLMVSVAPKVGGTVRTLHVGEGSVVQKDDLLLELYSTDYQLRFEEAQARVDMIAFQLKEIREELQLDSRRARDQIAHARADHAANQSALAEERTALEIETEQVQNQLAEAQAALKEAESAVAEMQGQVGSAENNLERVSTLSDEGIVSATIQEDAEDDLAQSNARLSAAGERVRQLQARLDGALTSQRNIEVRRHRVKKLEGDVEKALANVRLAETEGERSQGKERINILEAQHKEARAKRDLAERNVNKTVLRSPISGVISRKRVEEGQVVQKGQPVLVIGDPHDVWILANIKESYIRDVAVGKPVDVSVDAYPDREFQGTVDTIGHAAISEFALFPPTGSFTKVEQRIPVQITVPNANGLLKPGMMVEIGIVKD
jgi:membrane fusion protein (multidrug efflux system)